MADTDTFIALKGRFQAPQDKYYGLFFLLLNQNASYIDTASVVVSMYSDILKNDLNMPWNEFEKIISTLKYQGDFAQSVTIDLQESFKNLSTDSDFYKDLYDAIVANDMKSLKSIFSSIFGAVFHDRVFKMDIAIQHLTLEELKKAHEAAEEEVVQAEENKPEGVYLSASLILAPVGGKHVTKVKPGDKIMVKLDPQHDRSKAYIERWGLEDESGKIKPMPAEIQEVKNDGGVLRFLVKFEEGVFSEIVEEEKVLIRMFDPQKDKPVKQNSKPVAKQTLEDSFAKPEGDKSNVVFIGGGILIFLLIILIGWLMMS